MKENYLKGLLIVIVTIIILFMFFFISDNEIRDKKPLENINNSKETIENDSLTDILDQNNEKIDTKKEVIEEALLNELLSKDYFFTIYGTDERGGEIPRSDIIMILKYNPRRNKVYIVSIPRDTRVEIPNRGLDKINHAYAFGGSDLMTEVIEKFLLIEIDYTIKLSFENFAEIIDTIGGVQITAQKDFDYPGYIDIPKGTQILSGEKALEYVRFRYDAQGDYGRIQRQQEVLLALIDWHQGNTIDDTESILKKFYSKIDTNMSIESLQNFQKLLKITEGTEFIQYTLATRGLIIENIWYEIYDQESLEEIREVLTRE
jgi:LCP family protein required for cell wall assembly